MFKNKLFIVITGSLAVIAIGAALIFPSIVRAQNSQTASGTQSPWMDRKGGNDPFGMHGAEDTYLAEALGISVEDLQTARDAAWQKMIDQALEDGLITQAQADRLQENQTGKDSRTIGMFSHWLIEGGVDYNAILADTLGITVEELDAARQKAEDMRIANALADGDITQEQVDLMQARRAVRDAIDQEALLANALGISVEELQTAREERKGVAALIEESGLTVEEIQAKMQAGYTEAVQQAVEDGIITQEQADLLIEQASQGDLPLFKGRGHGGGKHGRGMMNPGCELEIPADDSSS